MRLLHFLCHCCIAALCLSPFWEYEREGDAGGGGGLVLGKTAKLLLQSCRADALTAVSSLGVRQLIWVSRLVGWLDINHYLVFTALLYSALSTREMMRTGGYLKWISGFQGENIQCIGKLCSCRWNAVCSSQCNLCLSQSLHALIETNARNL